MSELEYAQISTGPFEGKGFVRLSTVASLSALFDDRFDTESIELVEHTRENRHVLISEYAVTFRKKELQRQQPIGISMPTTDSWRKTLLPREATVEQVISSLNRSTLQIVLITTADDILIGTITDGDIRRGLLNGLSLTSSCEAIIHQSPLVAPVEMPREAVLQLMQVNRIHQMPVVNSHKQVVGLHVWNELILGPQRSNLMVIMAGGRGTRLRPFTENCPKPLLPVAGKPMLEHIIERARGDGFRHFVLAIHYLGHMIEDYFGDGSRWQVQIDYVREEKPLGTAGALSLLAPRPVSPFLVSNGDVLTAIRYSELLEFHLSNNAIASMAVRHHEWQHPFGVVNTDGVDIIGFEEKPISRTHINAGIYVFDPQTLDHLVVDERCDMPELFTRVLNRGQRAIVYPMHEPWLDLGQHADFDHANSLATQQMLGVVHA